MAYNNLLMEKLDRIGMLSINRPKVLNALNKETLIEMKEVLLKIEEDADIDVLIITGAGDRAFVAGADISYMKDITPSEGRQFGVLGQEVFRLIDTLEIPVIAAVNGFALGGGCELALACDFRIASTKAKFGLPEVGLGIIPGFGGTQRLPRLIGPGMAKQLMYTAEIIDAQESLRIGLVNYVVEHHDLIEYVMNIAKKITNKNQLAVRFCKLATNEGMQTNIDRGMSIEAHLFGRCFIGDNQAAAMNAFLNRKS